MNKHKNRSAKENWRGDKKKKVRQHFITKTAKFVNTIALGFVMPNYCQRYSSVSEVQRGTSAVSMRAINCC